MTTTNHTARAEPTPFEPDWEKVYEFVDPEGVYVLGKSMAVWAIREYQRQLAASGFVVVRRDDVATATGLLLRAGQTNWEGFDWLMDAILAAVQDASDDVLP